MKLYRDSYHNMGISKKDENIYADGLATANQRTNIHMKSAERNHICECNENFLNDKETAFDELHRMAIYMKWVCGMFFLY